MQLNATQDNLELLEGEITRVQRFDSGYTILTLKKGRNTFKLVGDMPAFAEGMNVKARAEKTVHPKYGEQFKVVEIEESGFATTEAIVNYLSSPAFKGIGVSAARAIVNHFGMETFDILDEDPDRLFDVPGLPDAKAQIVAETWLSERAAHKIRSELIKYGMTPLMATKVHKYFGDSVLDLLAQNIYLLTDAPGIGFLKADEIALRSGVERHSPDRVDAAIMYVLDQALTGGDCYLGLADLTEQAVKLLKGDINATHVLEAVRRLVSRGSLVNEKNRIFLSGIREAEKNVAEMLQQMLTYKADPIYQDIDELRDDLAQIDVTQNITLAPQQEEALLTAMNSRVAIITGGPGVGKALSADSLIPTVGGLKRMDQIKIGDKLFGRFGQIVTVTGVYPQGVKQLYRVVFNDRTESECCAEHLWPIQTKRSRSKSKVVTQVINTTAIIEKLQKGDRSRRIYVPLCTAAKMPVADLPIHPYLLGVLIGDGSLSSGATPRITSFDPDVIHEIERNMPQNHKVNHLGNGCYSITGHKGINQVSFALSELGLMGCKSHSKFIPELYLFSSIEQRLELLQGLMDTDGTVSKNGYNSSFCSVSKVLAENVAFLARSLGCKVMIATKKGTYTGCDHISYRVNIVAPGEMKLFKMPRKALLQKSRSKYQPVKAIRSIEPSRLSECVCISVDAPDKLYCSNDFIVTHNTTITKALCALFDRHNLDFMLCAPTGRAAKRLAEATGSEAKTIHRLLQFDPRSQNFLHNQLNPLPTQVVVIDESSMMDLRLFRWLMLAMERDMRLIIVGDKDQLPSVGPGNVLRDLISSGVVPCVKLDQIFRQAKGNTIIPVAHDILHGVTPDLPTPAESKGRNCMMVVSEDQSTLINMIVTLVTQSLPKAGFKPEDIQILTPMRARGLGIEDLNPPLQEALNPAAPHKAEVQSNSRIFRVGDRVMQIRNNYKKGDNGVFNGDIGYISSIIRDGEDVSIWVSYPDMPSPIEYAKDEWDELQHCMACTVHKSQGAEYPCVILVQHPSQYNMLQRNLIYTGVTRAKKLCVIAGTRRAVEIAVGNDKEVIRNTTLAELLQEATQ